MWASTSVVPLPLPCRRARGRFCVADFLAWKQARAFSELVIPMPERLMRDEWRGVQELAMDTPQHLQHPARVSAARYP